MSNDHQSRADIRVRDRAVWRLAVVLLVLVAVACTPGSTTSTLEGTSTVAVQTIPTIALRPPAVDVGVDLESGVIRLAIVGDVSDDLWAGHVAYWKSVNEDLGGVGGRFEVELVRVDSIRDAVEVGALAVSVDVGDDSGIVLELLVATSDSFEVQGRLSDVTEIGVERQMRVILANLDRLDAETSTEPPAQNLLVTHAERECSPTDGVASAPLGVLPEFDTPIRYLMCVPGELMLSAAAEALRVNPGSWLIIPGSEWRPELARQLAGTPVYVAGYLPGPGVEGAPAGEVMALILGDAPWSGDLVEGYRRALSMHLVLEQALDSGDLSRLSVREAAGLLDGGVLGFGGGGIAIGVADVDEPTGVRFVLWADDLP